MWHGEPTWAAGSEVVVEGAVTDEDNASAELELIDERRTVVWSVELAAFDAFSETVTVPAAAGEYHFEMKATCNAGVSMETGFHVEVE